MILEKLSLTDFRVFQGKHDFDLSPRTKYGKKRPIILYGGLNGAGKTTTLTAIRLALYGKQSLGMAVSQKDYDEFLAKSIHRSRESLLQTNNACIELTFNYAKMGLVKHYTVKRQWTSENKKVHESLTISEDGKLLSELNQEQCQGFLNELIPIGVSELFFFDAEKISDLAKDAGGTVLGDSIKKLLGLDIIETLDADLTVLLRSESKKLASAEVRKEIDILESELKSLEEKAAEQQINWEQSKAQSSEHSQHIERLENELSSRGGAWAATREKELVKHAELQSAKTQMEAQLREIISGNYPIAIASSFCKQVLKQLDKEREKQKQDDTATLVETHLQNLRFKLTKILDKQLFEKVETAIEKEFKAVLNQSSKTEILHGLSDRLASSIEATIHDAIEQQYTKAKEIAKDLEDIEDKIDRAVLNIARAPEENSIKPILDKIKAAQEKRAASLAKENAFLMLYKTTLKSAMEVTRKLDKISEKLSTDDEMDRTFNFATSSKLLLKDFAIEMAKRKVKDLENEFIKSFQHLARKEDISLAAKIDPFTFEVTLIGMNGEAVDKEDLSAGEKQIYAISILEALARTSGRKLPIIIDTPLGRLDSKHRSKFINNYFPYASHQVIILSTDTEVDEEFYEDLSSSISHAYKLEYDSKSGSTSAVEGYFWKSRREEIA